MLSKKTLVALIRYNTVFEQEERKDEKTGLVFQLKIKKVAAYHQYYAVHRFQFSQALSKIKNE
jgi:type I restriction enzyme R subunit